MVPIPQSVVDAIEAYRNELGASENEVMFQQGERTNPTARWSMSLSRFFKKLGIDGQSHDLRKTRATDYYNKTKDIVKVQKFLGHSSVDMTRKYIGLGEHEMLNDVQEYMKGDIVTKRMRT